MDSNISHGVELHSTKYADNRYLLKRILLSYVKPQAKEITIASICLLIMAITTALNAWLMQPILDDIFLQKNHSMLLLIPLGILLNIIVKGIASFYQSSTLKFIGQRIVSNIQLELYSHLIKSDIELFDRFPSGNLLSRFTNDINVLKKCFSDVFTGTIGDFITFIGLIVIMLYQSLELSIASFIILPLAFYPIINLGRKMRKVTTGVQQEFDNFTVRLDETFQNIRIIKSYCREGYEITRAKSIVNRILSLYKKAAFIEAASSPIMEILGGVAIAIVIWYGGCKVIDSDTTPGAFFSFITALLLSYKPLKSISQLNNSLQEGLSVSRRLFMMLDEKPKITYNQKKTAVEFANYNINFSKVCFSYNNDQIILDNLDIAVPQGKTVALIGTSGVGKTTILNLLQRLYDPFSGTISLGGYDIRDIKLSCLRNAMALVSQEIALFDDTIMENIRYGRLDATDVEVIKAAKSAAAHEFIVSFPQEYKTNIGQNGVKLSGGQKQRLAIARAILKNAPVLLLDEATSSLDSISERKVQEALENLKAGRTTIVIAHRLSTIEEADIIYLIAEGKVIEQGTHNSLLSKGGEYTNFYQQYKNSYTSIV